MIQQKRAEVIAVTPETQNNIQKTRSKTGVEILIVPDEDQKIMKDYQVAFHVTENYQEKKTSALYDGEPQARFM